MRIRSARLVLAAVACCGSCVAATVAVDAAALAAPPSTSVPDDAGDREDGGTTDGGVGGAVAPPLTLPLIPVPDGCEPAPQPYVVFLGTVIDRDFRTIRFAIDQVRSGRTDPFAARGGVGGTGDVVDVRFGLDAQYLDDGRQYLVGAMVDPDLGLLVSRIEPAVENFGGDEVIGVSETDVDCPSFDDPGVTVHPDGRPLEGSMLAPLFAAKWRIAVAVATPFAVACAVLFGLSAVRLGINGLLRGIFRPRRSAS